MATKKDPKDGVGIREAQQQRKELIKLYKLRAEQNKSLMSDDKELLKTTEAQIGAGEKILKNSKAYQNSLKENKAIRKGDLEFQKSFAKLSKHVRDNLTGTATGAAAYASINARITKETAKQEHLEGKALQDSIERVASMQEQSDAAKAQAEAAAEAEEGWIKEDKFAKKRKEAAEEIKTLGKEAYEDKLALIDLEEKLYKKTQRLEALKEAGKELYEEVPESLKSAIDFTKKLGNSLSNGPALAFLLIAAALLAGLESFKELDKAAEDYRKTSGMTVKQTEHLAHQAHEIEVSLRGAGVELKHVFDVANDLANVFGDMTHFSTQTLAALGGIQARTGVTSETAAKVQGVFEQVAGLSGETSANLQQQIASLAQQGKVSPKEVLEDIAENAEATSTFFKGDVTALKNQVIQAHQLGTTLTKVAKTAEELLNFESGIEDELVAATFVGGQFNLSTARGLAYAGKTVEAQEEILNQLNQGIGFKNQDIFAQKALAKAAGMSIEDINKQLLMKEKLAHLTGEDKKNAEAAISAGLDVKDLNDEQLKQKTDEFIQGQKITGQLTDMENSFKGIVATVGGALVPIFTALGPILEVVLAPVKFLASIISEILNNMYILLPLVGTLALYFGTVALEAAGTASAMLVGAIGGIFESLSKIPFGLGLIGAGAIVAGMLSMATKAKHVGDLKMPAGEGPTITTAEGAIYKGTKNDDVAMAPGITSKLDEASKSAKVGAVTPFGGIATSHAINILVDEMKQMRKDMASKSNDVYMDGSKVTANIASNVSKGTRNNFALGQA